MEVVLFVEVKNDLRGANLLTGFEPVSNSPLEQQLNL